MMKLMKLFAVLTLVGMSNVVFGYNFSFTNKTNEKVTVDVSLLVSVNHEKNVAIIQPNKSHTFFFKKPYCLGSVYINEQWVDLGSGLSKCCDLSYDITAGCLLGATAGNFELIRK